MQVEMNIDRSPLATLSYPESNGCRGSHLAKVNKSPGDERKTELPPSTPIDAILGLKTWKKKRRSPSPTPTRPRVSRGRPTTPTPKYLDPQMRLMTTPQKTQ
ncbi:retinal homeobox protein Rx1, partial [Caerostris extrusa]